jgi:hypothetical protein
MPDDSRPGEASPAPPLRRLSAKLKACSGFPVEAECFKRTADVVRSGPVAKFENRPEDGRELLRQLRREHEERPEPPKAPLRPYLYLRRYHRQTNFAVDLSVRVERLQMRAFVQIGPRFLRLFTGLRPPPDGTPNWPPPR